MVEAALTFREPRESVFLSADMTRFGQNAITRHRVRNLSPHGACLDKADMLKRGETVVLAMGLLEEVGATVMWVSRGMAGVRFAHEIRIDAAKSRPKPAHVEQGWAGQLWGGR